MDDREIFSSKRSRIPVALSGQNVSPDARLFAERSGLLTAIAKNGVAIEVGVALGGFTQEILRICEPRLFYAIDTFALHTLVSFWGQSSARVLEGDDHETFFRRKFALEIRSGRMIPRPGMSQEVLPTLSHNKADLIYIDASHLYEDVREDIRQAARITKPSGTIILNDYILYDHIEGVEYGVVQAVNEFVETGEWWITGFAFQQQMFCDVAIQRRRLAT